MSIENLNWPTAVVYVVLIIAAAFAFAVLMTERWPWQR